MKNTVLLAHDIGTSGTKSSLVRLNGTIAASVASAHATHFPRRGWAEQEPEEWWRGVCRNTRALARRHPALCKGIAGIGVSGHMLGCLPVGSDGRALRRCMIHSDCRAAEQCAQIRAQVGAARLYELTGNILDPRSPLCKVLWLKQHDPAVYAKTARFLQSKDYIVARLTGDIDGTDFSDATHAQWCDVRRKTYLADVFAALGLARGKFPALRRGIDVAGRLTSGSAKALGLAPGIPVVAGGGDGACATVGAGVAAPGDAYCCLGTTAWIACAATEPLIDPQRRLFNILALDGETCGVYGTVQSAGSSVQWAMDVLGEKDFKRFAALLAAAPAGSDGLVYLPYLEGERSPIWDANARGVYFGITPRHGRAHLLRAAVEGVSFALRSVLDVFRETHAIPLLRLIGGGARSPVWRELLANICNVQIGALAAPTEDATSLGAAIAAGVGVGVFPSVAAAARRIAIKERCRPAAALTQRYAASYEVYAALYPALKPAYELLARSMTD